MFDFSGGFGTVGDMKRSAIEAGSFAACAALCLACAAGCDRSSDRREARDPNLRRAWEAKDAEDVDAAIRWCEKALARRPDSALAHRELGLMLDHYRQDYVPAIFHYRRYLELRPDSADRADVEQMIQHCRLSFAAQIESSPEELKRALQLRDARIQALELEIASLRGPDGGAVPLAPPPPKSPAAVAPAVAPAAVPAQVHVVQAGDTFGSISTRYYGTPSKWKTIFNANRDRVPDENNLRVGTRLDIPPP